MLISLAITSKLKVNMYAYNSMAIPEPRIRKREMAFIIIGVPLLFSGFVWFL